MSPQTIRWMRQVVQLVVLILFFALLLGPVQGRDPSLANLFVRLDPLLMTAGTLARRVWLPGIGLAGITLLLTLIFGRVWCGWFCPLGTLIDWITPNRRRSIKTFKASVQVPDTFRKIKYVLLGLILVGALFRNQTFLFLDPITIMIQTASSAIIPGTVQAINAIEKTLYPIPELVPLLDTMHELIVYPLFRDIQPFFQQVFPITFLFCLILGLNWVTERFWCRYLCPLGGLLGLLARFSWVRREVGEGCTACSVCMPSCPTGTINREANFRSDPAECTVCYDCIAACSREGVGFMSRKDGWKAASAEEYDISRREALLTLGGAIAVAAMAGAESIHRREPAIWLRPPGGRLTDFEALCLRCGACVRTCPTQGLQPIFLASGWQNAFTPTLTPRLGPCSYPCNACGQVCPSGAIPPLPLAQKQKTPIGLARVDRNRCLPWVYETPCIVCEESCPLPEKAIRLIEEKTETSILQRPYVVKELCIGCGICESKCPMGGESAIRVYTYTEARKAIGSYNNQEIKS